MAWLGHSNLLRDTTQPVTAEGEEVVEEKLSEKEEVK